MTLSEARQILGLGPDEDPRPHLREFRVVRDRLAEMVRTAPTEALAERYQQGLQDIDRALAAIREYLEAIGLKMPEPEPEHPVSPQMPEETPAPARRRRSGLTKALAAWAATLLCLSVSGWYYLKWQDELRVGRMLAIARLEREGASHIDERRWPEAAAAFDEIERLNPESPTVPLGRRSIEAGMAEEQQQYGGYWNGQSRAALDAGRWDEAETAARKVLERFPTDREAASLLGEIAAARTGAALKEAVARAREQLSRRQWDAAIATARTILARQPGDADANNLLAEATTAKAQAADELAKARSLYQKALVRDRGQFDQQALDFLREAALLAPEDPEIASLLEKMASYTRTLRVPKDHPTPTEALANAHDRDRIVIGEGTWSGPLVVTAGVEIQGAGPDKTIIECEAGEGCVITLGPTAKGSRLSGITFRHKSQTGETERFSAALVRGATAEWVDCAFADACGHGLAVIEGGSAKALRCRFTDNGWNGASAMGENSALEIRESRLTGNFENGIEAWGGAALTASGNRCEGNSRNGIHADCAGREVVIDGNQAKGNREFGIVISAAGSGQASDNIATANLLGGMALRSAARLKVAHNQLQRNEGPGLVLEKGLDPAAFADNPVSGNTGKQTLAGFVFDSPTENVSNSRPPEPAPDR